MSRIPTGQTSRLAGLQTSFRVLVVSGERRTQNDLARHLEPFGYVVQAVEDGRAALTSVHDNPPDVVLADVDLDKLSGVELCRLLKRGPDTQGIPIALMTPESDRDQRIRGLHAGADDFLTKPIDDIELRARIRSLVRIRTLHQRLQNEKNLLEVRLRERTREINEITMGLVSALEKASELNDVDTGAHILRVCEVSGLLAETIGLPSSMVEKVRRYASLHDIGKVGVPDTILKKQASLTPDEWEEMKRHTRYGFELLRAAKADEVAQNIALYHHEKFDGSGYPFAMRGKSIPIEARIVAVSDVYDALVNRRCYKEPIPEEQAVQMVLRQSSRHFDPDIVSAFRARLADIQHIHIEFANRPPDVANPLQRAATEPPSP